jgi:hypothetical protein
MSDVSKYQIDPAPTDLPPPDGEPSRPGKYESLLGGNTRSTNYQISFWVPVGGASHDLYHYQPDTFVGNPAEVIAAMLKYYGLDDDYIDKDEFSDADDAYTAMTTEPILVVTRIVGESIADTLKRIMTHTYDFLYMNMAGKVALVNRDSPPTGPTSLTPADIIGDAEWEYTDEHLANYVEAGHGRYEIDNDKWDNYPSSAAWNISVFPDTEAQQDRGGETVDTYEDTTSQGKYGVRTLTNSSMNFVEDGLEYKRAIYRLPYFLDVDCKDQIMGRLETVDKDPRRVIKVVQDLRGLDYDIGYKVAGIAVTCDGDTITDARCIRKKVDFKTMRVTSWLLEE